LPDKHPNPEVDNLITALADHHSPFNKLVPVKFRQLADIAYTKGEPKYLALGEYGSDERKECRRLYDRYRKRQDLFKEDKYVPFQFDYWSFLEKTDELVVQLTNPSSSSSVSPVRRRVSPKRQRTPTQNSTSSTSTSIITPLSTMTSISKPIPEVMSEEEFQKLYATVEKYRNLSVMYYDEHQAGKNEDCITWVEYKVKNNVDGRYYNFGHALFPLQCPAQFLIANPRIAKNGRSIKYRELKHDPTIFNSKLTSQITEQLIKSAEKVSGAPLAQEEKDSMKTLVEEGIDMQITGLQKRSVGDVVDLETGAGRTIPSVPVREKEVLVDQIISNKFRNPRSQDNGLDKTLIVLSDMSDLEEKGIKVLKVVGDLNPTDVEIAAAMDADAKTQLYAPIANAFVMSNMAISTKFWMHTQVVLVGEEKDGTSSNKESLSSAFAGINLLG